MDWLVCTRKVHWQATYLLLNPGRGETSRICKAPKGQNIRKQKIKSMINAQRLTHDKHAVRTFYGSGHILVPMEFTVFYQKYPEAAGRGTSHSPYMTNVRKVRCKERSEDALEMERLKNVLSKLKRWRWQWHPTPVLLPGKSYGQRSLVGCSPWGC